MRHRIIFGPTALALCASALIHSDSMIDNGIDDSGGAGGPPSQGDNSNHVAMTDGNISICGDGDKVKVGSDDILAVGEGARDIGETMTDSQQEDIGDGMIFGDGTTGGDIGGTPERDKVPIGTFMVGGTGDTPDIAGSRLAA